MKRKWLVLISVLLLALTILSMNAFADDWDDDDPFTADVNWCIGSEARTVKLTITTDKSWTLICDFVNGTFSKKSGRGNDTVTVNLNALDPILVENNVSAFSSFILKIGKQYHFVSFTQVAPGVRSSMQKVCTCGNDEDWFGDINTYSNNKNYTPLTVPLDKTHHARITNTSSFYCYGCDAEVEDTYILGTNMEMSGRFFFPGKHSFDTDGKCKTCVYQIAPGSLTFSKPVEVVNKFKANASLYIGITEGELPDDIVYSLKNTKFAKINKTTGEITTKKPGTVVLTAKSAKLQKSVTTTLKVVPNTYKYDVPTDQIIATDFPDEGPNMFAFVRNLSFKSGKLATKMEFANRFGYPIVRIVDFHVQLRDSQTDELLSEFKKAVALKKRIPDGKSTMYTFSFPGKGLESRIDLTYLNEDGDWPDQIDFVFVDLGFIYDGPSDPYGYAVRNRMQSLINPYGIGVNNKASVAKKMSADR